MNEGQQFAFGDGVEATEFGDRVSVVPDPQIQVWVRMAVVHEQAGALLAPPAASRALAGFQRRQQAPGQQDIRGGLEPLGHRVDYGRPR